MKRVFILQHKKILQDLDHQILSKHLASITPQKTQANLIFRTFMDKMSKKSHYILPQETSKNQRHRFHHF